MLGDSVRRGIEVHTFFSQIGNLEIVTSREHSCLTNCLKGIQGSDNVYSGRHLGMHDRKGSKLIVTNSCHPNYCQFSEGRECVCLVCLGFPVPPQCLAHNRGPVSFPLDCTKSSLKDNKIIVKSMWIQSQKFLDLNAALSIISYLESQ